MTTQATPRLVSLLKSFSQTATVIDILIGGLVLLGWMLDIEISALSFIVLCVGVLCARPDRGLMAVITSDSAGGIKAVKQLSVFWAILNEPPPGSVKKTWQT